MAPPASMFVGKDFAEIDKPSEGYGKIDATLSPTAPGELLDWQESLDIEGAWAHCNLMAANKLISDDQLLVALVESTEQNNSDLPPLAT